jgi:hypothetical protein
MKNLIACILTLSILSSCSQPERKRNFICFIDLSASIDTKKFNEYAEILVHDIYLNLGTNDQIRIYPLDYASRIKNDPIFFEDISSIDFTAKVKTTSYRQSEMQVLVRKHTDELKDSLITIILRSKTDRTSYSFETDILGALEKVYREKIDKENNSGWESVDHYVNGDKEFLVENFVILFSDMIHDGGGINFNSLNSTTKADDLIKSLSDNRRIPDMSEIKVYVSGITARNNQSLDVIEHFWQQYFELANAELACINYNCGNNISKDLKLRAN